MARKQCFLAAHLRGQYFQYSAYNLSWQIQGALVYLISISTQIVLISDLVLEGVACPRKQSGKERRRLELQKKNSQSSVPKLPPLENNGLIERPKTRGGMAFDITFCPETGNMRKAQLPKLERRKKKKKLTKEELEEKMRKATERRQVRKWLLTLMVTPCGVSSLHSTPYILFLPYCSCRTKFSNFDR